MTPPGKPRTLTASDGTTFTASDVELGIHHALRHGDVDQIPGLLKCLAVLDPDRAADMLELLQIGAALRTEDRS
jgi:hypothetical protein